MAFLMKFKTNTDIDVDCYSLWTNFKIDIDIDVDCYFGCGSCFSLLPDIDIFRIGELCSPDAI